jgi:hypothetical protein
MVLWRLRGPLQPPGSALHAEWGCRPAPATGSRRPIHDGARRAGRPFPAQTSTAESLSFTSRSVATSVAPACGVPHSCPKRPKTRPRSHARRSSREGPGARYLSGFARLHTTDAKPSARPVTPEVAGSSPVAPVKSLQMRILCCQSGRVRPTTRMRVRVGPNRPKPLRSLAAGRLLPRAARAAGRHGS